MAGQAICLTDGKSSYYYNICDYMLNLKEISLNICNYNTILITLQ